MDYNIDANDMLSCPYNKAHQISRKRYQKHVIKCGHSYPDIILERCPFNNMHLYPESDMRMHIASCPDQRIISDFKYSIQSGSAPKRNRPNPPDVLISDDSDADNWDDEVRSEGYKPSEYAASAPIIRPCSGNVPSARKKFAEMENRRHSELNIARRKAEAAKIKARELLERESQRESESMDIMAEIAELEMETLGTTSSNDRQLNNRHRQEPDDFSRSYNQELSESPIDSSSQQVNQKVKNHFKVAIMHADHPSKTFRELDLINFKKAILCELDDIKKEDNLKPQFLSTSIFGGILSIICVDESSKNWLMSVAQGIELRSMPKVQIVETLESPRNYNCIIYQPHDDCLPKEILISRLIIQNPGIDISKWKYLRKIDTPDGGVEHHVCVDDASKAYLDRNHFHLFLNFSPIYVHFVNSEPIMKTESAGNAPQIINFSN